MRQGVRFKSKRVEMEWDSLYPPARERAVLLADYIGHEFGKKMTITCITRSKEENAAIYMKRGLPVKEDSLHVRNPPQAIDIRSTEWVGGKQINLFSSEQTMAILIFWRKGGPGFGGQDEPKYKHIHLQVKR